MSSKGRGRPPTPPNASSVSARQSVTFEQSVWTSPVPPPSVLLEYSQILPNAPERFLRIAEEQSAHRRRMESRVVTSNLWLVHIGQVFAFLLSLAAIGGGVWLIDRGHSAEGLGTIITAAVGLATAFAVTRKRQVTELAAKQVRDQSGR